MATDFEGGQKFPLEYKLSFGAKTLDIASADVAWLLPEPTRVKKILPLAKKDPVLFKFWKKCFSKELKSLIADSISLWIKEPEFREAVTPCMDLFKIKLRSYGSLDKGEAQVVVQGDLQRGLVSKSIWLPS